METRGRALRQGCARLRRRDATKFWREKRRIRIPEVVGKGQAGEEEWPVGWEGNPGKRFGG